MFFAVQRCTKNGNYAPPRSAPMCGSSALASDVCFGMYIAMTYA